MNKIRQGLFRAILVTTIFFGFFIIQKVYAKETLTIYTYESFITEWGPGPQIKEAFEKKCNCELEFVGLDSSIGILGRLQIEGDLPLV